MNHPTHGIKLRDDSDQAESTNYRMGWFSWPMIAGLAALLLLIMFKAGPHKGMVFSAYLNCIIGVFAVLFFFRINTLESRIPAFFLPLLIIAWPLASIYMAMYAPDTAYHLLTGKVIPFISDNLKLQNSVLLFLLGYLPLLLVGLRKQPSAGEAAIRNPQRVADFTTLFALMIFASNAVSKVVALPGPLLYVVDGLLIYIQGILFISGALITKMSGKVKLALLIGLPAIIFFYTLGNARGLAARPFAMFIFGILFFSEIKPNKKIIILSVIVVFIPSYMVIGNVTRRLTKSVGFENLGERWDALKQWRSATKGASPIAETLGRLFFTGGHSIITRTPEEYPFIDFYPGAYVKEAFLTLLPRRFYYHPHYSGNWILLRYGFNISETTSVEVSMLGNMWLSGGYPFVFLGGLMMGLFHLFLAMVVRVAWKKSGLMALLFFGLIGGHLVGAAGLDFIHQWRRMIWCLIFGYVFYLFLGFVSGEFYQKSTTRIGSILKKPFPTDLYSRHKITIKNLPTYHRIRLSRPR